MDRESYGDVPCSSRAVDSILRVGTAGAIWGLCTGPYDSRNKGLAGIARASFVAKRVGNLSFQCGFFGGVFSITHCGIQRYRRRNDWVPACLDVYNARTGGSCLRAPTLLDKKVNSLIAGAVVGAAIAARTRDWKQVIGMAGLVSAFSAAVDYSKPI